MSAEICQQVAGLLQNQACQQPTDGFCAICGKAICSFHSRVISGQINCLDCLKSSLKASTTTDLSPQLAGNDPYFYSYRQYPAYFQNSEFDDKPALIDNFEEDFNGS